MVSSAKVSVICNAIASLFSWVAFSLSITSVTSKSWHREIGMNYGLWLACPRSGDVCVPVKDTSWIRTVRAFMILMIIYLLVGNLVNILSQWNANKKARRGSGAVWAIAVTLGVVGASVYTVTVSRNNSNFEWDIGYILAWTAIGLGYLANLLDGVSHYYMPDSSCESK